MLRSLSSALVLVATAGLVQSLSISSQCQSTLLTIAGSPEAACLNPGGLAPIITATANSSLVQPINSWLEGACAQSPCTNQSLADIVTNITAGCGSDLSGILGGNGSESTAELITVVQAAYPTVRDILCLKDTTNNTLCELTLLNEIQTSTGTTLSLDNITSGLSSILSGSSTFPTFILCSDCVKGAFNILEQQEPSIASAVQSGFQSQCGADFVNGTTPSNIVEGTGTAAPTGTGASLSTNGATPFSSSALLGFSFTSLSAVLGAFLVLA